MAFDQQYYSQEWKTISPAASESENTSGCFDCNICLDFVRDPVVTLCGHLYCWPCIYKWFHYQKASLSSDEHPKCPVCKAKISDTAVVPLYGRGGRSPSEADDPEGKAQPIPPRPPACGAENIMTMSQSVQEVPYRNPYDQNQHYMPYSNEEDYSEPTGVFHHPGLGMLGAMVYGNGRVFGNSDSLYAYPSSYHRAGSSSPRLRRLEMQADESLNRISIFLFCCLLVCLLLF